MNDLNEQCTAVKFCFLLEKNDAETVVMFNPAYESLAHRRTISALSLYYRYYRDVCSVELKSIIPPKAVFTRNTRFSNTQHPFAVFYPYDLQRLELTPCHRLPRDL